MFKNKSKLLVGLAIFIIAVGCFANSAFAAPITGFSPAVDSWSLVESSVNMNSNSVVECEGVYFTIPQVGYALSKSIALIAQGQAHKTFSIADYGMCEHSYGADAHQVLTKSQYVDMATRYSTWTENHGQLPNFVGINQAGVPDISNTKAIQIWKDILIEYHNTGQLPATIQV